MATKKVNIDIVAKDKSKQALNKVQSNLDVVKKSAFNLKNALMQSGMNKTAADALSNGLGGGAAGMTDTLIQKIVDVFAKLPTELTSSFFKRLA